MGVTTGDVEAAPIRDAATGLSRRADASTLAARTLRPRTSSTGGWWWLARASLGMATFAMLAASCIITDVPQFEEDERTPPKLLPQEAKPLNQQLLFIPSDALSQTFSADVVSENDLDQEIQVRLFIDYGVVLSPLRPLPYRSQVAQNAPVPPATTPNEERTASATWFQGQPQITGCHTFTLMVSHDFDESTGCPENLADSSEITWVAYICDSADCQSQPVDLSDCPTPTVRCPDVPDDVPTTPATSSGGG